MVRKIECPDIPSGGTSEEHLRNTRSVMRRLVEQINITLDEIDCRIDAIEKKGVTTYGDAERERV